MIERPLQPLSEHDFKQVYPFNEFQNAIASFIKQATQNQISKTTKGSRRVYEFSNGARLDNHYGQGAASKAPYINYWWVSVYWDTLDDNIILAAYFTTPDISHDLRQQLLVSFSNPPVRYIDIPGKGPVINLFMCKKDELYEKIDELYSEFMRSISILDEFELTFNRGGRYVSGGWRNKMIGAGASVRRAPHLYEKIKTRLLVDSEDEIAKQISDEGNLDEISATLQTLSNRHPLERVNRIISRVVRNPQIAHLIKVKQGYVCEICSRKPFVQSNGSFYAEADHIEPLGLGGLDTPENMRCLCAQCHSVITHGSEEMIKALLESRSDSFPDG